MQTQTVGWENNALKKFLCISPITESISKYSLTKLYLHILRRKALITPFCIFVKNHPKAHRAYRIFDILRFSALFHIIAILQILLTIDCLPQDRIYGLEPHYQSSPFLFMVFIIIFLFVVPRSGLH